MARMPSIAGISPKPQWNIEWVHRNSLLQAAIAAAASASAAVAVAAVPADIIRRALYFIHLFWSRLASHLDYINRNHFEWLNKNSIACRVAAAATTTAIVTAINGDDDDDLKLLNVQTRIIIMRLDKAIVCSIIFIAWLALTPRHSKCNELNIYWYECMNGYISSSFPHPRLRAQIKWRHFVLSTYLFLTPSLSVLRVSISTVHTKWEKARRT